MKRILWTSGLMILALSACTKELPYKETLKEDVQEKSSIDTDTEYLYSTSMLNAADRLKMQDPSRRAQINA